DGADRRGERLRGLLEREIEDFLEDHRRALLGRELTEERARRFARGPRIVRRAARLEGERLLALRAAWPIEPQVRAEAEEPRARVRGRVAHLDERDDGAGQRVLREVLGVPGAPREVAAVAIEIRPQRLVRGEEALPRRLNRARQLVRMAHARRT